MNHSPSPNRQKAEFDFSGSRLELTFVGHGCLILDHEVMFGRGQGVLYQQINYLDSRQGIKPWLRDSGSRQELVFAGYGRFILYHQMYHLDFYQGMKPWLHAIQESLHYLPLSSSVDSLPIFHNLAKAFQATRNYCTIAMTRSCPSAGKIEILYRSRMRQTTLSGII